MLDKCQGCKHFGKYEEEVEAGMPSPCTNCGRRVNDNYEESTMEKFRKCFDKCGVEYVEGPPRNSKDYGLNKYLRVEFEKGPIDFVFDLAEEFYTIEGTNSLYK